MGRLCQACDEEVVGAAAPPPAAPLGFTDVLDELRRAAALAERHATGLAVVEACRRVEALLLALRSQFLADVVHGDVVPRATDVSASA